MTREQQIEEMANLMTDMMLKNFRLRYKDFAQALYEAGYHQICSIDYHNEQMHLARNETVNEFAERLKKHFHAEDFGTPDEKWLPEREVYALIEAVRREYDK